MILDHKKVLALADHIVATTHLYAAPPSADPAIAALAQAMCAAVDEALRPIIEVLAAPSIAAPTLGADLDDAARRRLEDA